MNLTKKRWLILLLCCLANLCLGSVYAWSVFASPMAEYLSGLTGQTLTTADLAVVYTVANSVGPITMISGGWFNDTFGPKKVIFTGGLMFGMGMVLSGFASSVGMLMLTYGILSGLGLGMAYGCTISSCVKYFPDKRGLIGGLTTACYGLSSVILPPVVTVLVGQFGAASSFKIVGAVFVAVICVSALFIEPCPAGFVPDGWKAPETRAADGTADKNWKEMLRSPVFYIMIFTLTTGAFSGMMIISQASAVGKELIGMDAASASLAVSVLALFNAAGRLAAGYLSDRIGRINTLTLACMLSVGGTGLLYFCHGGTTAMFYAGISIVGICFGSFMGVFPGFTADQFGARNNSVNYGIMFIGFALAGYFGPTIMRGVYYEDGSYHRAFLIACGLSAVGVLLTLAYRAAVRKKGGFAKRPG